MDFDTSSDILDFDVNDSGYDTLDNISDNESDFKIGITEYETLDAIPDIEDESNFEAQEIETLEDIPDEAIENDANIIKDLVDQNVTKAMLPYNGEWTDPNSVGNSDFIIADDSEIKWRKNGDHSCSGAELKQWMNENYGVSTVHYDHKEPDFSPFENKEIGTIYVDEMSTERSGEKGTFSYAEQVAAERMGTEVNEVKQYMSDNELTWHECADGHTIKAIPTRINAAFKHSGGISLKRSLESMQETISQQTEGASLNLQKDSITGTVTGLEQAIDAQHKNFRGTKTKLFSK